MATTVATPTGIQQFEIVKDEEIAAPIDLVFETLLEQLGPLNETPDGKSLNTKLEAWPGGRWYRDLGSNQGHLWGHVQAVRSPDLLEIQGPMFMSAPVSGHILYRLSSEAGKTRIRFSHRVIGLLPPEMGDGSRVVFGWTKMMDRLRELVAARLREGK